MPIAYAAAKAREVLGCEPDLVKIGVSNNIIKNVKSVVVPNTDGMKGIEAAAVAGILGGNAAKELEVISEVTANQKAAMRRFLSNVPISVEAIDNGIIFDIIIALYCGTDSAVVRISQYHTNIVYIKKNDEVLLDNTARQTSGRLQYGGGKRPDGPQPADDCQYLRLCRDLRPGRCAPAAGHPDFVQHPDFRGRAAGGLRARMSAPPT